MSDLPMQQVNHSAYSMPKPTEEYNGTAITKLTDPMHNRVVPEAPIARYDGDGETKGSVRY